MENVIVYKRLSASDSKGILSALRDGYMVLMPNGLANGTPQASPSLEKGPVIPRRRRRSPRRIGPAPKKAKQIRNQEIIELKNQGWSLSAIGKRYGLSAGRVWQISRSNAAAKKPTPEKKEQKKNA